MANEEITKETQGSSGAPKDAPSGRVSRWKLFVPVGALAALFGALAVFWFWSIRTADRQIDAWIAREAAVGRVWTCPDRTMGGFPFRIDIRCKNPSFTRTDTGLKGTLAGITAAAQIYQPTLMIIEVDGPLQLNDGRANYTLNWDSLRASLRGRPGERLDRLSIEGKQMALDWADGMGTARNAKTAAAEFHIRRAMERPAAEHSYDVVTNLVGFTVPALDPITGGPGQAAISLNALITHADPFGGQGIPVELERWRVAGGKLIVNELAISKDASRLAIQGEMGLDDRNRPQGALDVTMSGLDGVLKNFGMPPVRGENGNKAATLKLRFDRGQIFLGPLPLGRTFPLY